MNTTQSRISILRAQWQARGYSSKDARYLAALSASSWHNSENTRYVPPPLVVQNLQALPLKEAQAAYAEWLKKEDFAAQRAVEEQKAISAAKYAREGAAQEQVHLTHVKAPKRGITGGYIPESEAPARKRIKVGDVYSITRERVIATKSKLVPKAKPTAVQAEETAPQIIIRRAKKID